MPQLGQAIRSCTHCYGICFLIEGDPRCAARAIDGLRRGWTIAITGPQAPLVLMAVERLSGERKQNGIAMLLSASRAATLKLSNQRDAAVIQSPVMIALPQDWDNKLVTAIADPVLDMRYPMKGPFAAQPLPDAQAAIAAMELARLAGILPAYIICKTQPDDAICVNPCDIDAYNDAAYLQIAARARLPVAVNAQSEIIAFRSDADATDHIALVIGNRDSNPPLIRLHSECLTGDILGSLKCDCGPQLHEALSAISETGWGILLYLRQEGRGIGLINKLRAYALQDQGFDTVDANIRLGFEVDARDFSVAAQMLRLLSVDAVRLLTNNPEKERGLTEAGISVIERVPLKIAANPHNAHYLDTKRDRTGHKL